MGDSQSDVRSARGAQARAVAALALCSASLCLLRGAPAEGETARARLAAGLARSTGTAVDAGSVVFESPTPIGWVDALRGRAVLFTAVASANGSRDVFRARVRVTPAGAVLGVTASANLTRSPLGDDGPLMAERAHHPTRPRRVAFATRAFGAVQSVSVLDPGAGTGSTSLRRRITRWMERATFDGDAHWDLRLDRPAQTVAVAFPATGAVQLRADDALWRVDLAHDRSAPAEGLTVARAQEVEKPLILWAVDTVRGLPFVGTAPITWLEEHVFGLRDRWRRLAYRWWGLRPSAPPNDPVAPEDDGQGRALQTGALLDGDDPDWPPQEIAPPLGAREGREGQWVPAAPGFVRRREGAPPAFYRTFLRLDRERPYARLHLLAMDMRQLELGMQAGIEDPVPLVGPRGDGRIPRRPGLMERVVGAFNGAFKTEHGAYGMVVDRRVLLPPRPRGATVATFDDGTVSLGTWGPNPSLPEGLQSLRQNLDPLLADGVENPTRRALWGFVIGGIESMPTVRSGLCGDARGRLVYVWGEETTGRHLARAMRLAGCDYGLHLDMNPSHATFHFVRVDDIVRRQYQHQTLVSSMHTHGDRFLYYTLKDFFYLALRPADPDVWEGTAWSTEALPQPPPRWMPTLHRAEIVLGQGHAAEVFALDARRVRFALRAGRQEPSLRGSPVGDPATTLSPDAAAQLLGAWELGVSRDRSSPRGVRVDGRDVVAFAPGARAGFVGVDADGVMGLGEGLPGPQWRQAVAGTMLLRGGAAVPGGDAPGDDAPQVLARARDGRVYLVITRAPREVLTAMLVRAGVVDAVALHGATGARATHWRGEPEPLRDAYPSTTLFLTASPMPSPVTRLEPRLVPAVAPEPARH